MMDGEMAYLIVWAICIVIMATVIAHFGVSDDDEV